MSIEGKNGMILTPVQRFQAETARLSGSGANKKESNPKDVIGVSKWRQFFTVPARVMWEVGVGMLEGAAKYGRHNYRVTGVCASVYTDAALGHIQSWVEGEDIDADSGLSHITKAICSLIVLRDGMLEGNFTDDRPPRHAGMDEHKAFLQARVEEIMAKYPDFVAPYTQADQTGAAGQGRR